VCGGAALLLCWKEARRFHFEPPDIDRFPALQLGYEAVQRGGSSGAVLNAANEAAVERFRGGTLRFVDIAHATRDVLLRHETLEHPTLVQLLEADGWARKEVAAWSG
jgi:1-deoxy-D-xylulose-5-phosphate reductoisomerase